MNEPEEETSTPVIELTGDIWEAILPALGMYPDMGLVGYEGKTPSQDAYSGQSYDTVIDMSSDDSDSGNTDESSMPEEGGQGGGNDSESPDGNSGDSGGGTARGPAGSETAMSLGLGEASAGNTAAYMCTLQT